MTKIVYVDDQIDNKSPTGGRRYQERLSQTEDIECQLIPPPKWDDLDSLIKEPPDLFLIDYQLSMVQPDRTKAAYRGSTLAAEIRMRLPDYPIVLITRETISDLRNPQIKRQITDHVQVWDELIFKSMLINDLDKTRQLLISIADGFRVLRDTSDKTWKPLVEILGANEDETDLLKETAPPLQEGEWIVTGAANWIRNVILEFPGILYDPVNAATCLGISIDSFYKDKVQELVEPAKYTGIFAPPESQWWRGRLFKIAKELTIEEGVDGPINRSFAKAFRKRFGSELSPAICVWDHTPIADWVCYILDQPVKIKNSLRYYPDNRPSVMDNARVSFRAIRKSNKFDEQLLDSEGIELLDKIKKLPEPPKT